MTATHEDRGDLFRREVVTFFETAERYGETRRSKFAAWAGVSCKEVGDIFPDDEWEELRDDWLRQNLRKAMAEVYEKSIVREEFNIKRILTHFRVEPKEFKRVVSTEWLAQAENLPTIREKLLADLAHLVEINTPPEELTAERLFEYSGYGHGLGTWISIHLRAAKIELASRQVERQVEPPAGDNIHVFPGGYVDLDSLEWDLNLKHGLIRRTCLRPDVAEVAWPLLKEDVRERRIALSTVGFNYRCFITAGKVLGTEVPEVHSATLEAVQRAWISYGGTRHNYSDARAALVRIFISLHSLAEGDPSIDRQEMLKISAWLKTMAKLPRKDSGGDFLSENELSQVITACLLDIKAGMEFVKTCPDLLTMGTRATQPLNATPVISWAIALTVLVMVFTGMRRASVVGLRLNDWMQIRSELFAIAWQHSKNGEESLAVTPALITRLLDVYVRQTESVRKALGIKRVFLTGDATGSWSMVLSNTAFYMYLNDFVARHGILRDGKPIPLNSTIIRRTYATHQLYKGRSLEWIRAQLGHKKLANTKGYTQFDLYEHPAHVSGPLDSWAKRTLGLWHNPVNAEDVSSEGRASLYAAPELSSQNEIYQHARTGEEIQAASCSTCEHLVTGPDYAEQWEQERVHRDERVSQLTAKHLGGALPADELEAHERFINNYRRVMGGAAE